MTGDDPMYENAYKKPVQHYWDHGENCVCGDTWPCEEIQKMWDDIDPPVTPRPKLSHPQLMALVVTPVNGWYEYHYSVGPTEEPDDDGPLRLDERLRNVREVTHDGPPVEPGNGPTNHHAELAEKLRNLRVIRPDGPPLEPDTLTARVAPPEHYAGKIEPFDYVKAHDLNYWEAAVLKYITRARRKHPTPTEDYRKARNYLTYLIEEGQRNE